MPLSPAIHRFLAAHNTLTLATIDAEGQPHACALFYVVGPNTAEPNFGLYFLSDPKTQHGQHIGEGAAVAASIEANNQNWKSIQGLQLHGRAESCVGKDEQKARAAYAARYPFVAKAETLAGPLSKAKYYKITPDWIRLIDNTKGFGHKEEWRR